MGKTINTRIQLKNDTENNWNKAKAGENTNGFIPLLGEAIVYMDENGKGPRLKIGDGETNVTQLPFLRDNNTITDITDQETYLNYLTRKDSNDDPTPPSEDVLVNLKLLKKAIPPINKNNPIDTSPENNYTLSYYAPTSKGAKHSVLIAQGTTTNNEGTEPLWLDPTTLAGENDNGHGGALFYGRDMSSAATTKPFKTQWGILPVEQGGTGVTNFTTDNIGKVLITAINNDIQYFSTIAKTSDSEANTLVLRDSDRNFAANIITLSSGINTPKSDGINNVITIENTIPTHYGNLEADNLTATIGTIDMSKFTSKTNNIPIINWYKTILNNAPNANEKVQMGSLYWDSATNQASFINYSNYGKTETFQLPEPTAETTNAIYKILTSKNTLNGALYTSTNGSEPIWGTLPIEQGGTGTTSAPAARSALGITPINIGALSTNGSNMMTGILRLNNEGDINWIESMTDTTHIGGAIFMFKAERRWRFRQMTQPLTSENGAIEDYILPEPTQTNGWIGYDILTSKSPVLITQGGTGANDAPGARTNLDVPSRTGSDASGTWGINITGTAKGIANESLNSVCNQLINSLEVGNSVLNSDNYIITQYANSANENMTTYYRRLAKNVRVGGLTTARTLTIGNTGKLFDGTKNISWSLSEIGVPSLTGSGASGTWGINITGTASKANVLNSNDVMDYGWNGINYFNLATSRNSEVKNNQTPYASDTWTHILRFNHANNTGYYTDLAIPFNANSIWYRRICGGGLQNATYNSNTGWVEVLDAINYTSYCPTKTGSGASGTWGINVTGSSGSCTGNAATASAITNITTNDAASSSATWRRVWISYDNNITGRPAYSDNLVYQTSTNTLKSNNLTLTGTMSLYGNIYPSINMQRTDAGETSIYLSNNTAGWAVGLNVWNIGAGGFGIGQYSGTGSGTWRFRIDNNGYCYTNSYLNLGGGRENNASSPAVVWGSNSTDNFLRSYQTTSLTVGYADRAGALPAPTIINASTITWNSSELSTTTLTSGELECSIVKWGRVVQVTLTITMKNNRTGKGPNYLIGSGFPTPYTSHQSTLTGVKWASGYTVDNGTRSIAIIMRSDLAGQLQTAWCGGWNAGDRFRGSITYISDS